MKKPREASIPFQVRGKRSLEQDSCQESRLASSEPLFSVYQMVKSSLCSEGLKALLKAACFAPAHLLNKTQKSCLNLTHPKQICIDKIAKAVLGNVS